MTAAGDRWHGPALGLVLSGGPGPVDGWAGAASWFAALEADGCEAIWFTDHLFFPYDTPEALTIAAVAAASTTRCLIGTAVLQAPLRPAALVAKAASTVHALAPGRVILGVGIGELEEEFRLVGSAFATRGRVLDESIDRWRSLWQPGAGWFTQKPVPGRLPVWVGGRSSVALERVVQRGDGWMPMFVSPAGFARRVDQLASRLDAAGRPDGSVVRAVLVLASVDSDAWSADDARTYARTLFDASPDAVGRHVLTGSAEAIASAVDAFLAVGAEHVAVLPMHPEPMLVHAQVAEALRGR